MPKKEDKKVVSKTGRREFIKTAAITVGGIAIGAGIPGSGMAQFERRALQATPLTQKAILPDGKGYTRAELLQKLGLNPGTPPEAWIVFTKCGSNAAALFDRDAKLLLEKGLIKENMLDAQQLQRIRSMTPTR